MTSRLAGSTLAGITVVLLAACAPVNMPGPVPIAPVAPETPSPERVGVLVMAHGGGPEWNASVERAVEPIRGQVPTALAFGMADPQSLQAGLDSLEVRGVETVAVVRLFISGESFLHQTEYLFGLREDAPERAMMGHHMITGSELEQLETSARVLLDLEGLGGSSHVGRILADRARAVLPQRDGGVLLLAHGMGAESENDRVLAWMQKGAEALRHDGYADVRVATLREDWADARERAEAAIRASVEELSTLHGKVAVIPYRLSGFGPYADVLDGLEYRAGEGLLPHAAVSDWLSWRTTSVLCAQGLRSPLGGCGVVAELTSN